MRPLIALGVLGLSACAGSALPEGTSGPLALVGEWDTKAQFDAAPEAIKRPATAGGEPWLDRQHARFTAIKAPGLAGPRDTAVFFAWRTGGPEGPVSRERIWVFEAGNDGRFLQMNFHTLKAPAPANAFTNPDTAFAGFTQADVISYPAACKLPVETTQSGWRAAIPAGCAITARSGRRMSLSASIVLDGDRLSYEEAGVLESGAFAFKVPGAEPYRFARLAETGR